MFESREYYCLGTGIDWYIHWQPDSADCQNDLDPPPVVFYSRDVARRFCEFFSKDLKIFKPCPHTLQKHAAIANNGLTLIIDVQNNSVESATLTWEEFLQIAKQA